MPSAVWMIALLVASSGCHLVIDRERHSSGDAGADAGARPDSGQRDAGQFDASEFDAGCALTCGPTGYTRCQDGGCVPCSPDLTEGVPIDFWEDSGDIVAPPVLLGSIGTGMFRLLVGGFTLSRGAPPPHVSFGIVAASEVPPPTEFVNFWSLEGLWQRSVSEHDGAAMVTTAAGVVHVAIVHDVEDSPTFAVSMGVLPSSDKGPDPTVTVTDRSGVATGQIVIALDGEDARPIWTEVEGAMPRYTLEQSDADPIPFSDPIGSEPWLTSAGPFVVAPATGGSDSLVFDAFNGSLDRPLTADRTSNTRVAAAWRVEDRTLYLAWVTGTAVVLSPHRCIRDSGTAPVCTSLGGDVVFEVSVPVDLPALLALPRGAVVAVRYQDAEGGDEVLLLAFDGTHAPHRVDSPPDRGGALILDRFAGIADIAAMSYQDGGVTHMVFGVLPDPTVLLGTHLYRIQGCAP